MVQPPFLILRLTHFLQPAQFNAPRGRGPNLIGQTVIITKGLERGLEARVRRMTGTDRYELQLIAKNKIINLDTSHFRSKSTPALAPATSIPSLQQAPPQYPVFTPHQVLQTPSRAAMGMSTPAHPSSFGMMTPSHTDDAWARSTPAHHQQPSRSAVGADDLDDLAMVAGSRQRPVESKQPELPKLPARCVVEVALEERVQAVIVELVGLLYKVQLEDGRILTQERSKLTPKRSAPRASDLVICIDRS